MKKTTTFIAAAIAAIFVSCKKEDPDMIQFVLDDNLSFDKVELVESVNANVTITASRNIDKFSLAFSLGDINSIVNQHIGIAGNKGLNGKSPVFDLIEDPTAVSYLQDLGIQAGTLIRGAEIVSFNLSTVLLALIKGQPVENDATFSVEIKVTDQGGFSASRTVKFHFTSAPEITWPRNTAFSTLNLDRQVRDPEGTELYKLSVKAPGKIASLVISLDESTADNKLSTWIVNRVTPVKPVIDLIDDPLASNEFKDWFPTRDALKGAEKATLNFLFVNKNLPDFSDKESLNTFTITVTDRFGKKAEVQAVFHVPAKTSL